MHLTMPASLQLSDDHCLSRLPSMRRTNDFPDPLWGHSTKQSNLIIACRVSFLFVLAKPRRLEHTIGA